jgi:mannosyltransferase OCH1-like enzyme
MQFWDTSIAPQDVEDLMTSWRTDPQFIYHRYCWESARTFIQDNFGLRILAVFDACGVPAMQADVFRLCWLFDQSGIYVDADQGNRGSNSSFTDRTSRGHLFFRDPARGIICNGLMSFFNRHDPLVGMLLERVCCNVEARLDDGVWHVTGPGVISKLFAERDMHDGLFRNVHIHGVLELCRAMRFVRCGYKSSQSSWQNVVGSIYRTAPA